MMKKQVLWDELAVFQLESHLNYIKKDSTLQAKRIKESILAKTSELSTFYEKHPKDK